jgi:hypothetical protein
MTEVIVGIYYFIMILISNCPALNKRPQFCSILGLCITLFLTQDQHKLVDTGNAAAEG